MHLEQKPHAVHSKTATSPCFPEKISPVSYPRSLSSALFSPCMRFLSLAFALHRRILNLGGFNIGLKPPPLGLQSRLPLMSTLFSIFKYKKSTSVRLSWQVRTGHRNGEIIDFSRVHYHGQYECK